MLKISIVLYLSALLVNSWNVEYVGKRLVMPIAMSTQETLYCPCQRCVDAGLDLLMKWILAATMHP